MKVPTPKWSLVLPLLVVMLYFLSPSTLSAQCVMACNNGVEVALDDNCQAEVLPDMILEGISTSSCAGPFLVVIQEANGTPIPSSPFVNASHIGQTLIVMVTDQPSGNNCWGTINVVDGLAPVLSCDTLSLPCSFDVTPADGPPITGILPVAVAPQQAIGPAAGDTSRIGLPVALPDNAVVTDLNLSLNLSHSNSSHLDVFLLSPSGLQVELATDVCGNAPNWSNLTFDDEALVAVNAACGGNPALSGSVRPEGNLSDFDGHPAQGLWQLLIIDDTNGGAGLLSNANLQVSYEQRAAYRPAAMDACGPATLNFIDAITPGSCADTFTQIIRRTWTATDASGNSRSCTQLIVREREDAADLRLPPSFDGLLQPALKCDERQPAPGGQIVPNIGWNALPNGHPSPFDVFYPAPNDDVVQWLGTGVPEGGCGDFLATYNDTRIDQCTPGSPACFKIVRLWTINDWCTGQLLTHTQVLKVADHEGPMISGISDASIGTNPWNCSADWIVPAPVLSDNCDTQSGLSYTVSSSGGTVSQNLNGSFQISGLVPGDYTVTYTATDCCGNNTSSSIRLSVTDQIPPAVACDQYTQAALNIDGTTTVPATTFDDGSQDNCGPVFFKVIRMSELLTTDNGSTMSQSGVCGGLNGDDDPGLLGTQVYFDDFARFCCEDLGGTIPVVLRVFDIDPGSGPVTPGRMAPGGDLAGRFNQCMAFIELVDKIAPRISCPADVRLECTQDFTDLSLTGQATATDNCQLDSLFYTDVTDLNMCNAGTVVRTWMAIDAQGQMAVCTQNITLIDPTTPTFFFPADVNVSCGASDDPSITGEPFGVDSDCAFIASTYTDQVFWFQDSCLRKVLREWKIIDWCSGASETDLQVIKELDDLPPVFSTQVSDTTVDCSAVPPPASVTVSDSCDPNPTLSFSETRTDGLCEDDYQLRRVWLATDRCGNSDSIVQIITVQDTIAPSLTQVPADTLVDCDAVPSAATPTASDNCDPAPSLIFRETRTDGSCADNYNLRRVWTVTDRCGNQDSSVQIITVQDTLAPMITGIPAGAVVECDQVPMPVPGQAIDNCDPSPMLSFSESRLDGNCEDNYILRRVWTATDRCGNQDSSIQIINVVDQTAPVLEAAPADTLVNCDALPTAPTLAASDNCDPMPVVSFTESRSDGICIDNYTLRRVWLATDRCGNQDSVVQIITVQDTVAPVLINVPTDTTVECTQGVLDNNVMATDNCDPQVNIRLIINNPDGPCNGNNQFIRTWIAIDNCGNSDTARQVITLIDTIPPVISGVPNDTTVDCSSGLPSASPIALDDCTSATIMLTQSQEDGDCLDERTVTRIWTATDECGNIARDTQRVTFIDTLPPSWDNFPADTTVRCDNIPNPLRTISATDNCDNEVDIIFLADTINRICENAFTIRRTWIAGDNCMNSIRDTQIITVIDTIAPIINGVPDDTTMLCENLSNMPTVSATDDCDVMVELTMLTDTLNRICENSFTIRRIWIAEDNCGNSSRDSQLVNIIDTIAPMIMGVPADTTLSCSDGSVMPDVSATDDCDTMVNLVMMIDTLDQICENSFTIRRIWIAEDNCGNSSRDSQLVNVVDTIAPMIVGVPADTTVVCENIPPTPRVGNEISITDNCDTLVNITLDIDTIDRDPVCLSEFTIVRRWTAEDNCGNISRDSQTVMVIDTLAPMIMGVPADTIVSCDSIPTTPAVDTTVTIADNCDADSQLSFRTDTVAGSCPGEFTIFRIWRATDKCSNISLDTQRIEVVDTLAPVLTGIPNDTMVDCRSIPVAPELGAKVRATDNCDTLVTLDFMESEQGICPHTYVLTRTWTATDDCGNQQVRTQRISVEDSEAPVFDDQVPLVPNFIIIKDTFIVTQDSCDILVPIIATATDNCDDNVRITNDSQFAFSNDSGDASGNYPIGEHTINFTATDTCGNSTMAQAFVRVIDAVGPATSCNPLVVTLDPVTGTFTIFPEDVATAFDACSPPATLAFEGPSPDSIVLSCADLPRRLVMVESFDSIMLPGGCDALVTILLPPSNPTLCDSLVSPLSALVSGQVLTDEGVELSEVEINAEGGMSASEMTESSGYFTFQQLPTNEPYEITPHDNNDPLQGVNSYDLVLISRHILGINYLNSPYKIIAADVNNSGSVTTMDMVELRKLILYINTEFENNTSWRFVPTDYSFADPANPFTSPFPEFYKIDRLEGSMIDVDFVGIKTGDLNGSASFSSSPLEGRNRRPALRLHTPDRLLQAGKEYELSFRAEAFTDLAGLQFTLNFDAEQLEFLGLGAEGSAIRMQEANWGQQWAQEGVLTAAWGGYPGQTVEAGDLLFSLRFRAKSGGRLQRALRLSSDRTPMAVFDTIGRAYNLNLTFDQEPTTAQAPATQLFQNRPNPFARETLIPFFLAEDTEVQLSVFDVSGRLVKQVQRAYPAGYHEVPLRSTELPGQALYYYQLQTPQFAATRKMVFTIQR
ncbi:MAG: proprotein convertase P-domain-containing protein [Bacteroidota bacterium]